MNWMENKINTDAAVEWARTWFSFLRLDMMLDFMLKLWLALIVFFVLIMIAKTVAKTIKKKIISNSMSEDDDYSVKIWNLIWDIIFYILSVFAAFMAFEVLGFDTAVIIWWISFAIWFAFQEILWNMIAWVLLLTTKSYKLWDIVEVTHSEKFFGRIEEITIRQTIIRTFDMRRIIVPNSVMINSPVKTFNSEEIIRSELKISVHYDTDLKKASQIIKETINEQDWIMEKDSTNILVDNFGESWIDIIWYYYIDPKNPKIWKLKIDSEIKKRIHQRLAENNINIPYPHTVLTVDKNDKNLLWTIMFPFMKKK